jgi:hypothetical protein
MQYSRIGEFELLTLLAITEGLDFLTYKGVYLVLLVPSQDEHK